MTTQLRMYRLRLERRELAVLAQRHRIPHTVDDSGYLVHAALSGLFTDAAPKPFAVEPEGPSRDCALTVLGYGTKPLPDLLDRMRATADVQIANCLRKDECHEKLMPDRWLAGSRFGFRVRACPVKRRTDRDKRREDGKALAAEHDAFLVWPQANSSASAGTLERRRDCYAQWLNDRINGIGGVTVDTVDIEAFRLASFIRRNGEVKRPVPNRKQAQQRGASGRPDVVLAGTCTITDPAAFTDLLAHGIGRHRAFGFGMILLKSAVG